MKHTFLTTLLLLSTIAFGQTKYNSLNDACSKNQVGSGVTNNPRTIYIQNFGVGQSAFLNNTTRNYRRLGSGYYYHSSSNSAFQTNARGTIISTQACNVSGTASIVNQFATGLSGDVSYQVDNGGSYWYYQPNDEFYSQVDIVPNGSNHVNVNLDTRGFGNGSGTVKFKVENSINWLTKTQLEATDFSNMKGRDVSIIAAMFNGSDIEEIKQSVVHFAGDNTSTVPSFYKRGSDKRLAQLPYVFPDFESLDNKINILGYGQLDASFNFQNHYSLNKGFNVIDWKYNEAVPVANRIGASYDEWAYNHGCPRGNGVAATNWVANTSMQDLFTWFNSEVIQPASGHIAFFVDFEAWAYYIADNQGAADKMASLFRAFKQANPNTMLLSYVGTRGFKSSTLGPITNSEKDIENAKYEQTLAQVGREFEIKNVSYINVYSGNYDGTSGYLSEYIDVVNAGDYQHFISHSWFYSTIQEMELAKIFRPGKKVLPLLWSYIETVPGSDFTSVRRYHKKTNGQVYFVDYKAAVPFSHIYNNTAWGNFLGDGIWFWHDPYPSLEGFDYHGGAGKDPVTATHLPNNFSPNNGMMEVSTTIGYDWAAMALYELSHNKDIIAGNQPIQRADFSTNAGTSYYTGEDLKPASADYLHIPVVRIKKHPTLNEWLLLAVNRYNEQYNDQTIKVKIPGTNQIIDVVLKGQFTSIKRIQIQ